MCLARKPQLEQPPSDCTGVALKAFGEQALPDLLNHPVVGAHRSSARSCALCSPALLLLAVVTAILLLFLPVLGSFVILAFNLLLLQCPGWTMPC